MKRSEVERQPSSFRRRDHRTLTTTRPPEPPVPKNAPPPPAFALGQSHRKQINRDTLAQWDPRARRRDPLELLARSTRGRVGSLLPLKTERMSASPFGFFRGAAPVMAYDLSLGPHTGITNQICGDAHVQNLGAYTGLDGRLVFDINDFDETLRAPFEWDLKRMCTSILLAGADASIKPNGCQSAAEVFLEAYCDQLEALSRMPVLEAARFQVHRVGASAPIARILLAAERSTPMHTRDQLTVPASKGRVFRSEPPLLRRVSAAERAAVLRSLPRYRKSLAPESQHLFDQFQSQDVSFKVVGTGSVGMRDYVVYFEGNVATGTAKSAGNDPLFLQIKEETASAYAPYLPKSASPERHNGQRVADGQRAMQLESDPLLGWTSLEGRDFLVRQLNDHKASLDVTTLDQAGMSEYAQVCGELLARGHARSGEASRIAGYLGNGKHFRKAILEFATAYADQSRSDWKLFVSSNKSAQPDAAGKPKPKTREKQKPAAQAKASKKKPATNKAPKKEKPATKAKKH